jgi:hypothetical protein
MTTPLSAVPETSRIATLLAELSGRPRFVIPSTESSTSSSVEVTMAPPRRRKEPETVQQIFRETNWNNEEAANETPSLAAGSHDEKTAGPLPAPFGVLTIAAFFGLVNWRNRPDEVRPRPTTSLPPDLDGEVTVESALSTFDWQ